MAENGTNGDCGFDGGGGDGGGEERGDCITSHVEEGSAESHRYYLSRRTVLEMLRDRGYEVPDSELTRSLAEFRSMMVIFLGTEEIRTASVRNLYAQIMSVEHLKGLILIHESKINHFARKGLAKYPYKVEVFQITDLLVNITKHILMPKHEILNAEGKQRLLSQYKVKDAQLPRMLETDPVARYYGLEKGQVVKVTYSGEYIDSLETYRAVL
ncbi:dna-directed rna polymerase v subunit 5c [Quercus suber]|uniref:Dna-directed rna polymerase v subunit 5c n=1 Tax=Quercus suber TaxID=58331 RepID=A0AAW0KKG5_QUESU